MWDILGTPQATNIVSLVLVAVTGVYVFLTYKIAAANSKMAQHVIDQQEEISRPVIVANIEIRSQVLFVLLIRNTGRSVATDVHMRLKSDFFRFGDTKAGNLRDLPIFNRQPFTLAPGDALRFDLAQGFVLFADDAERSKTPDSFQIDISYSSRSKKYNDALLVDLTPYRMTNWPKSEIALEIEKLTKAVARKAN